MLRGLTHSASCLLQRIGGGSHSHRLARAVPQAAMALNTGKPHAKASSSLRRNLADTACVQREQDRSAKSRWTTLSSTWMVMK